MPTTMAFMFFRLLVITIFPEYGNAYQEKIKYYGTTLTTISINIYSSLY